MSNKLFNYIKCIIIVGFIGVIFKTFLINYLSYFLSQILTYLILLIFLILAARIYYLIYKEYH